MDETVRFGGLANVDQSYASVPVGVNGLAVGRHRGVICGRICTTDRKRKPSLSRDLRFPAARRTDGDVAFGDCECGGFERKL